jgi:hypothetical protein
MTPFAKRRMLWVTIAVVFILFAARALSNRKGSAEQRARTAEAAAALREGLLTRQMLAQMPPKPGAVRGAVMDWGLGGGLATMLAIDDGTVSLYLNPGGGVIGAGTKPNVAAAATRFRAEAERVRDQFTAQTTFPKPANGSVVFYLLTDSATLVSPAIEWTTRAGSGSPLAPLNEAAQELMTQIRKAS